MDDEGPLWSQDDFGHYYLLFPNKHALSLDEIREIFSRFGEVRNIRAAGDERGFRFVQFDSVTEVENAVQGLKDHAQIKLLPYRPRAKSNKTGGPGKPNRASSGVAAAGKISCGAGAAGRFGDGDANGGLRSRSNSTNSSVGDSQAKNFYPRKKQLVSRTTQPANSPQAKDSNSWKANDDNLSVSSGKNSVKSLECTTSKMSISAKPTPKNLTKLKSKLLGTISPTLSQDSNCSYGRVDSIEKQQTTTENGIDIDQVKDEIPELTTNKRPRPAKQIVVLPADEVVVANIHEAYGSAYILHLLDEFEPLAVSYIKRLSTTDTRYCHIYFKSAQVSMIVEKQFDKYCLEGKELIVLRSNRLMQEAEA